jgi:Fe-S-cluster containining protein
MKRWAECEGCAGYCCIGTAASTLTPITEIEIRKIAKYLGTTEEVVRRYYVARYGLDLLGLKFGDMPCLFWAGGGCSIYPVRPAACRDYVPVRFGNIPCKEWHKARAFGGRT